MEKIAAQAYKRKNNIFISLLHKCNRFKKDNIDYTEFLNSFKFKSIPACKIESTHKMKQIKRLFEMNKQNLHYAYKKQKIYSHLKHKYSQNHKFKTKKFILTSLTTYNIKQKNKKIYAHKHNFNKKLYTINYKQKIILLILSECKLSFAAISAQINKLTTPSSCPIKLTQKANFIFQQLLIFIDDMTKNTLNRNQQDKNKDTIRTKILIENACLCLDAIAELNQNRFIFRNLDAKISCNKILLSRLILNACYQILSNCEKQSIIEVISYTDKKNFIIEFLAKGNFQNLKPFTKNTWRVLIKKLKCNCSIINICNGETMLRLSMPYENTRF